MTDDGPPPAPAPSTFGDVEDLHEIGRGGFAVVYKGFQPRFGRQVAVKVLDPGADALSLERFGRECEAMGRLSSHPNIVTIFDAGVTAAEAPFLVMEHMAGGSLDDRLEASGPLPWAEVVETGIKLCGALETAHRATILHRDVKPANILLSSFGEPCLSDFGLARFGGSAKTTGVVTATLLHAPPEVLGGEPADPRADVYSLGSTLHTLLAGQAPFWRATDESILALIARIAHEPAPDLRGAAPDEVCSAIEAALAKDADDRPPTAADLGEALRAAQAAAGVAQTAMRVSGDAPVDAARRALADRDPGTTVARRGAPGDDDRRTIKRAIDPPVTPVGARTTDPVKPTAPPGTPTTASRGRRWPARLAIALAVAAAVVVGIVLFLPSADEGDDGGGGGGDGTPTATTRPDARTAAAELTDLVNAHRADEGLSLLPVDRQLAAEATRQAQVSAEANALLRSDLEAVGDRHPGRWSILGENVLSGSSVVSIQEDTLASSATLDNLDRGDWNVIGIGVAVGDDGRTLFVVEYFAQRIGA